MRPQLSLSKKLFFSLTPTILLLAVAELLVRLTGAADSCPTYRGNKLWTCDPVLYFKTRSDLKLNGVPVNSAGFRGRDFRPKPPGVYRILALGDSCTFGMTAIENGLYVKEPYPQHLERLIAERAGPGKVEVLNAGAPGYNSYQGVMLLRTKLRGLQPDLITVRFGWNDHLMSPESNIAGSFRELSNPLLLTLQDWLLHTALYPFSLRLGIEMQVWLHPPKPGPVPIPPEYNPNVSIQEYEHNLRRITELGRRQGAKVWLLTSPHPFVSDQSLADYEALPPKAIARKVLIVDKIPSFRRLMEIHDAYNAATRAIGEELHVPVLDMAELSRQHPNEKRFSMGDVVHPTQEGYDLEAEALYARLVADDIVHPH